MDDVLAVEVGEGVDHLEEPLDADVNGEADVPLEVRLLLHFLSDGLDDLLEVRLAVLLNQHNVRPDEEVVLQLHNVRMPKVEHRLRLARRVDRLGVARAEGDFERENCAIAHAGDAVADGEGAMADLVNELVPFLASPQRVAKDFLIPDELRLRVVLFDDHVGPEGLSGDA